MHTLYIRGCRAIWCHLGASAHLQILFSSSTEQGAVRGRQVETRAWMVRSSLVLRVAPSATQRGVGGVRAVHVLTLMPKQPRSPVRRRRSRGAPSPSVVHARHPVNKKTKSAGEREGGGWQDGKSADGPQGDDVDALRRVEEEIERCALSIERVEDEIRAVAQLLRPLETKQVAARTAEEQAEIRALRDKENKLLDQKNKLLDEKKDLRVKEKQLRDEKKDLRDKEKGLVDNGLLPYVLLKAPLSSRPTLEEPLGDARRGHVHERSAAISAEFASSA